MLKMGLPEGAVRNAMDRDGVDSSVLDLDPEKSLESQATGQDDVDDCVPIKDDPAFQKYFKMLKMGLPQGAVRNAMDRDGVDSSVLDLDPDKSVQSQRNVAAEDVGLPLKDDPEWSKYFKMLQMGLPLGAVNPVRGDRQDRRCEGGQPRGRPNHQSGGTDGSHIRSPVRPRRGRSTPHPPPDRRRRV